VFGFQKLLTGLHICCFLNHSARLEQVENIISRLGMFGHVWEQKGIIGHVWEE
jgi:hypothetical protein